MIAHAAAPLIVCATAAWTGLLNPSGVSDADGFLLLCGDEQCISTCASAVIISLQCFASEPATTLGCISDATLLLGAVAKHHIVVRVHALFSCMPISHSAFFFQSEMLAMWGVDAALSNDIVVRMSAAASHSAVNVDSSALVQWMQSMLDHAASVPISWSTAFAAATNSTSTVVASLSDVIYEVTYLLPSEKLDLNDADHAAIFHALARAEQLLLRTSSDRSLIAVFDGATTRCFQDLSRNMQTVVQRCVQTDEFCETAAPSVKHSSSAVDVGTISRALL